MNRLVLLSVFLFFSLFAKAGNSDSITVYIFLSETCPICQSSTLELKELYKGYDEQGIEFIGLFPNTKLSDEGSIRKFAKKYSLPFDLKPDKGQEIAKQLSASTTPQVFVVRNSDKAILYKGKIDNSFESIGKRRGVVTEHYLKQALENILHNQPVNPAETKPVGCFITKL
jgi:peroxiredoxin